MIRAVFHRSHSGMDRAEVCGHAGYAPHGSDIVCASVTSAVQLAANAITEVMRAPAEVFAGEDTVTIRLKAPNGEAERLLEALRLHLELLSEQFEHTIHITVLEN